MVVLVLSKKIIDIFGYKQRLLSIDMKTIVVQHVANINISYYLFICRKDPVWSDPPLLSAPFTTQ